MRCKPKLTQLWSFSRKADSLAYRSADRKQFDALTNRMREAAKSHRALKKEVEVRLQDVRACYDQVRGGQF